MRSVRNTKRGKILHQRRLVCENNVFEVFSDDIEIREGHRIHDYLVVAPKNKLDNLVTGVAILPVSGGKIGLIKIYRHAIQDYSWEIPRGFINPGESRISAAMRELQEETALACKRENMRSLCFIVPESALLAARVEVFVAPDCTPAGQYSAAEFGHEEFHLLEQANVAAMIDDSDIQDPCTLVACLTYFKAPRK